ncbi:lachrymatory-factor synthase-like [Actinidia eriantha]|uniref:lachrymatory-factor synthase-like n=1 Tax=Actinidia eriantha TaxID=165200 RepID=UPI002583F3A3|nr:lachrymatory-factor synthase-like [Actinidia eriantha]
MAEEATPITCTGTVTARVEGFTRAQVWPFLEDFGGLHKIDPLADISYALEGVYGHPGLIRFCASSTTTETGETKILWFHEKLLAMDPTTYSYNYEVLENNVGFTYCKSSFKVVPIDGDEKLGSQIEWTYVSNLFEGKPPEHVADYFNTNLQIMATNIKKYLEQKS